jgi:hypothetical protein
VVAAAAVLLVELALAPPVVAVPPSLRTRRAAWLSPVVVVVVVTEVRAETEELSGAAAKPETGSTAASVVCPTGRVVRGELTQEEAAELALAVQAPQPFHRAVARAAAVRVGAALVGAEEEVQMPAGLEDLAERATPLVATVGTAVPACTSAGPTEAAAAPVPALLAVSGAVPAAGAGAVLALAAAVAPAPVVVEAATELAAVVVALVGAGEAARPLLPPRQPVSPLE